MCQKRLLRFGTGLERESLKVCAPQVSPDKPMYSGAVQLVGFVLGNCYTLLSCEVYEYLLLVILRTSDLQPKSERSRMFRNQRERTINLHAKFSRLRVFQISKLWSKLSGAGRWRTDMMSLRLPAADTQAAARRGEGKAEPCCRSRSVEMAHRASWGAVRLLARLRTN